jgi:Peptidase inhibitor family I36
MRNFALILIAVLCCSLAEAQFGPNWSSATPPENGACFYDKPDFKGDYFCLDVDASWYQMSKTFNHKISSVRVIGKANVKAFSQADFKGDSILIADRTPSLKQVAENGKKWDNRIASVAVVPAPERVAQRKHVRPKNGVCVYTEREYEGRELCVDAGATFAKLPKDFDRKIASLRTYGDVDLLLYTKPEFQGAHTTVSTRVRDMRELTKDTAGFYDWNNKVASLEVRLRPTGETARNESQQVRAGSTLH